MHERPADRVVTREELEDLADKYARILALREARDRSRQTGAEEPDPSTALRELSTRWPGALRELDELPLDVVRERRAALQRAAAAPASAERWMLAHVLFHATLRGALVAKRWLGGRRALDADAKETFVREAASLPHPEDALAWKDELDAVARPPRGRVLDLVWAKVAGALAVPETDAKVLVLPPARCRSGCADDDVP